MVSEKEYHIPEGIKNVKTLQAKYEDSIGVLEERVVKLESLEKRVFDSIEKLGQHLTYIGRVIDQYS